MCHDPEIGTVKLKREKKKTETISIYTITVDVMCPK